MTWRSAGRRCRCRARGAHARAPARRAVPPELLIKALRAARSYVRGARRLPAATPAASVDELGVDPVAEAAGIAPVRPARWATARPAARLDLPGETNLQTLTSFVGATRKRRASSDWHEEPPGHAGRNRRLRQDAPRHRGRIVTLSSDYDAIWLVELAPVTDPAEIPHAVLASIGRRDATTRSDPDSTPAVRRAVDELRGCSLPARRCSWSTTANICSTAWPNLVDTLLADCPQLAVARDQPRNACDHWRALVVLAPLPVPRSARPSSRRSRLQRCSCSPIEGGGPAGVRRGRGDGRQTASRSCAGSTAFRSRSSWRRPVCASGLRTAARLSTRFIYRLRAGTAAMPALPRPNIAGGGGVELGCRSRHAERLLAERLAVFPAGATTLGASHGPAPIVCADQAKCAARTFPTCWPRLVRQSLLRLEDDGPRSLGSSKRSPRVQG